MRSKKRVYEVTRDKILLILFLGTLALTVVYEIGVFVGKKRAIKAQMEVENYDSIQARKPDKVLAEMDIPHKVPKPQIKEPLKDEVEKMEYTVQVGTFGSRKNAENLVKLLESYEYKSWMDIQTSPERTLYLVMVGSFKTKEEAEDFGNEIKTSLSYITDYRIRKIEE
jgi:cell division septation protein DedD